MSIYHFHAVTDIVSGLIYKETRTGQVSEPVSIFAQKFAKNNVMYQAYHKNTPLKNKFMELLSIAKGEGHDYRNYFTEGEMHLINGFWNPIAAILHHVHPSGKCLRPTSIFDSCLFTSTFRLPIHLSGHDS
jgi:hypothetical protein